MTADDLDRITRAAERIAAADDVAAVEAAATRAEAEIAGLAAELAGAARATLAVVKSVALERAHLRAADAESFRTRETLLAGISHDLRNPLNTFAMSTGLLRDDLERGELSADRALGLVSRMERAIERMQRLIEDLHEASRIEGKQIALTKKKEEPRAILARALTEHAGVAKERGATLSVEEPAPELEGRTVEVDRARLVQAIGKLVAYAVRITGEGGALRLGAFASEGAVTFALRAGGLPTPITPPKNGLSLLIARGIVEAHGSALHIDAHDGLSLAFTLPAAT